MQRNNYSQDNEIPTADMTSNFTWPVPPHLDLIPKTDEPEEAWKMEAGVLTMNDGSFQQGTLIRINHAQEVIEFRSKRATENAAIPFADVKSLRLAEPITLDRLQFSSVPKMMEAYPASERQKCTVNFKKGAPLTGETVGYISHDYGLFLFLISHGSNVLRWFIPSASISSFQIGAQLGQLLVDQKIIPAEDVHAGLKRQEELRSQKLGDYLQRQNIITKEQVEAALQSKKGMPALRLGEALLQEQLISEQQLELALTMQSRDRKLQLGDILVEMKLVDRDTIKRVLAQKLGIPFVNLRKFQFEPNLIKEVPGEFVRKHAVMPLFRTDTRMVVALENPMVTGPLQELAFYTKLKIDPVMASEEDLAHVIQQFYGGIGERENISELVYELGVGMDPAETIPVDVITDSDNTLVRLVNKIIIDAFEQGVSDIHIETMKGNKPTRVRFRKDGVLFHYSEIPANFRNALVSRIKIMSRLDISEKRHSQDGKLNFEQFGPARIELRVVTMPTTEGLEDIVMRILAAPKAVPIDGLGLAPSVLTSLKKLILKPHGLLFVCGPTGSGKTTTLHALLGHINTPERKIWTVEDPIEITQEGLRQVQVQAKIDWTFAAVLRSFMRADPDVIMVGETRDPETARIVIEASLTGHLVLSTMHTNSAAESVVRLLDLGLDPFNFADALVGVLGQRLARRLCTACHHSYVASEDELAMLAHEYCMESELSPQQTVAQWRVSYGDADGEVRLFSAVGCAYCDNSGYKGRLGIHELLTASPAVKKKIHARATVAEILQTAVADGMRNLRQDGIEKILQGRTDWEQIRAI